MRVTSACEVALFEVSGDGDERPWQSQLLNHASAIAGRLES